MENLKEKVSYLKGLTEGLELEESKETKLLKKIISVLQDFADAIDELEASQVELEEYVEAIDEDLGNLERDYYNLDDYEEEPDYLEVTCPHCNEVVFIDESIDDEVLCPNCRERIEINDNDNSGKENE